MARYLLDASAFYPLVLKLREKLLDRLSLVAVLDLTVARARALTAMFAEVLREAEVVSIEDLAIEEVLQLALAEDLTFYDAAHLYAARRLGLKLVSEDADLKKYSETIGVDELVAELEGPGRS
jgi:predicted nucleic acid-binding protein